MKIFILCNKPGDNYSSLPTDAEKVFLYSYIPHKVTDEIARNMLSDLVQKFADVTEADRIVYNGPSWLIALASYVWMTEESRRGAGMFVFNNFHHRYEEVNCAIEAA